jgi:signal transduction histidine kinase
MRPGSIKFDPAVPKALAMGSVPASVTLRARLLLAIGAGSMLTILVGVVSTIPAGGRNAGLHIALETAASVIAALAALLMYGRYGRSQQRSDLVLTASLAVFAIANLGLGAVPAIVESIDEAGLAWAGVLGRGLGAALMTTAAFMPPHELRRPAEAARRWLGGSVLLLAYVVAIGVLGAEVLSAPLEAGDTPGDAFAAHPAILAAESVIMVLFGAAALGLTRRADEGRDGLMAWFAIGAVFATFARMNYVIYPSVLTDWFAAGDLLRLGFFLCLLAGGAAEIRLAQRAFTETAVHRERERIARDLHDGTAQELAFILQVGRRLARREGAPEALQHVATAAQHALDNTRDAIADLVRPSDEPLTAALRRTAQEVAGREGVHAEVTGADELNVPAVTREGLCLLLREAVTNAIRHGGARRVLVTVEEVPELRLRIDDDGRGFDPEQVRDAARRFGLAGMDQRVARLGGELRVSSQPGKGTELVVLLP